MPRFGVDLVDLWGGREIASPPGAITAAWFVGHTDPATGITYKVPLSDMAAVISNFIGQGIVIPDRVYRPGVEMPAGSSVGTYPDPDNAIEKGYLHDPYLVGKVYAVNRRGTELLMKGVEWDNDLPDMEIRLLQDDGLSTGDQFTEGEIIIVQFQPQISQVISAPDAVARFSAGIQQITTNTTLTAPTYRKIISLLDGYAVTVGIDYPENVLCMIMHDGLTNKQGTIIAPVGQSILFFGQLKQEVYIGKGERAMMIRIGTTWYLVNDDLQQGYIKCLTFSPGRFQSPNQLLGIGGTILRVDYPRVYQKLLELEAFTPQAVAEPGAWATNPTLWGWGNGTTTINVPQVDGMFFRWCDFGNDVDVDRIASGIAQFPGTSQGMAIEIHNHDQPSFANRILAFTGLGTATGYDNAQPGSSEPDLRFSGILQPYGGSETRPINTNELPLINI